MATPSPWNETPVSQNDEPTRQEGGRTSEGPLRVIHDSATDGNSRRELTEDQTEGYEEQRTQEEREDGRNRSTAYDHPVADKDNPARADDGAEPQGEVVHHGQMVTKASMTALRLPFRCLCCLRWPTGDLCHHPSFLSAIGPMPVTGTP